MATRLEVFAALNSERKYQSHRWNEETTTTEGVHPVASWLTFIRSYVREAEEQVSRNADPEATKDALHTIRKIGAMCVACLEQLGSPDRAGFECYSADKKLELLLDNYACIDGAHHKQWVLDQIARELMGDKYEAWVAQYEVDGEYEWDTGIAP